MKFNFFKILLCTFIINSFGNPNYSIKYRNDTEWKILKNKINGIGILSTKKIITANCYYFKIGCPKNNL